MHDWEMRLLNGKDGGLEVSFVGTVVSMAAANRARH